MNTNQVPDVLSCSTGSDSALAFLIEHYYDCLHNHETCRYQQFPATFYPTRLLDVGKSEDSLIHLRETRDFDNKGPYVCLSHCWGGTQHYTLTEETNSSLQNGVSGAGFRKTFRDAIYVTRRLGLRFLWIDSLYAILVPF